MKKKLIPFILILLLILIGLLPAAITKFEVKPCFNGIFTSNSYFPILVNIESTGGSFEGLLEVRIFSSQENEPLYIWKTPAYLPGQSNKKEFELNLPIPQWVSKLEINLYSKEKKIVKQALYSRFGNKTIDPGIIPITLTNLEYNHFLAICVSEQMNLPVVQLSKQQHKIQVVKPDNLPQTSIGYSSVSIIVLCDVSPDNAKRYVFTKSLLDWVRQGGLLVISPNPQCLLTQQEIEQDQIAGTLPFRFDKRIDIKLTNEAQVPTNIIETKVDNDLDEDGDTLSNQKPVTPEVVPAGTDSLKGIKANIDSLNTGIVQQDTTEAMQKPMSIELYKIDPKTNPYKTLVSDDNLIYASWQYGLGQILVLGLNVQDTRNIPILKRIPFDTIKSTKSCYDTNEKRSILTNIEPVFNYKGRLKLPSILFISLFLFSYIIFIGPVNYFLFSFLKKRIYLWYSIPATALLWSIASYAIVYFNTEKDVFTTQLNFVSAYTGQNNASVITLNSVFSPSRQKFTIKTDTKDTFLLPINKSATTNQTWEIDKGGREFNDIWFSPGEAKSFLTFKGLEQSSNISCRHSTSADGTMRFWVTNNFPYEIDEVSCIYGDQFKNASRIKAGETVNIVFPPLPKPAQPQPTTQTSQPSYYTAPRGMVCEKIAKDFKWLDGGKDEETEHINYVKAVTYASLDNGYINTSKQNKYFSPSTHKNPISYIKNRLFIGGWTNRLESSVTLSKSSKRVNLDFYLFEYVIP